MLSSIENRESNHCVDFFVREDGSFGFEEYRRDVEDARGWFSLRHYAHLTFETQDEAMAHAIASVAWMKEKS